MFTVGDVLHMAQAAGFTLHHNGSDAEEIPPALDTFCGMLNEYTKTFMPQGAPALTLSKAQAELVRDMLAPPWCMHMIKITAFEQLAHLPLYAGTLGSPQAYAEVASARKAIQQIEYVLSSIVMQHPIVDPKEFIQFARDPDTKVVAPMYNHLMALQYAEKLGRVWQTIPVFDEGDAN